MQISCSESLKNTLKQEKTL